MDHPFEIIPYQSQYQAIFRSMNLEWLDKYNLTEDHDLQILDDPQGTIVDNGGFLWLAKAGEEIIGSAGIMKVYEGVYEIAKMSVVPTWRGRGISKKLLEMCIQKARACDAEKLILFSNHQLSTALKLYEQYGFRHVDVEDAPFVTADVKMELVL